MKRILVILAIGLLGAAAQAREIARIDRATQWVRRAPVSAASFDRAIVEANATDTTGARPIALLETNYYTFNPGEPLQLRVTVDPNGFGAPVTMYLYNENRTTGERRYYNVSGAPLAAGVQADLFGTAGAPVPVFVPSLNDFVLFGTADGAPLSWGVSGVLGASIAVPSGQTGLYQFVFELRDAAGKRVLSRSNAMYSYVNETVNVSGQITASQHWTADKRYVLHDYVGVAAPAVLTIDPGTVVYGGDGRATLFIQRGAKIMAEGTAKRPIIMTSAQKVGSRAQKDWGSLVLLGDAPINVPGGQAFLEGLPSQPQYSYGGANATDSSGVLRYVRLEFGGFEIATNQEINGLTLGGVGSGTVIDYIEVLHNKDDCVEWFGGTANAKHILGIACADDALDFDNGNQAHVQFAAFIKRPENDEADSNTLTEADNDANGSANTPLSNQHVYNVTSVRVASATGNYGAVLRRNTAGAYYNAIVEGTKLAPVNIRDAATISNGNNGTLIFDNSILFGDFSDAAFPGRTDGPDSRNFIFNVNKYNRNVDPMLAMGTPTRVRTYMPDLTPLPNSPALDADYVAYPPDNGFFEAVDYLGAVGPGDNWILSGWANFSDN
ncbi:MAG: hypothetical protein JO197_16300 [Acidobacteria bacterium]|nr:hypothetical protein [Acidobacteriota bacterium]MBV9475364.1 hypothetical protein [Acidobacteriota bacterium]